MAVNVRLSIITVGILLLMFCITDTECNVLRNKYALFTNLSDDGGDGETEPQSYPHFLRQAFMDAGHVLDNVIRKGKIRLTELPHEGWLL